MSADPHTLRKTDPAGNTTLSVGPMDVDSAAEVTAHLGVHNRAHELLQRHAKLYPAALRTLLSRPIDGDRSTFLREDPELLQAVQDAALAVSGRRRFMGDEDELLSASVQGDASSGRIIGILFRTADSGRSARGVIDYGAVPAIERAFQAQIAQPAQTHSGGGDGSDVPTGDSAALEAALRDAEAKRVELEQELETAKAEAAAAANPEPFDGYDELTAQEVIQRVKDGGHVEFGLNGLDRIAAYEESQGKPRSTVIEAVRAAIDDAPSPHEPEQE